MLKECENSTAPIEAEHGLNSKRTWLRLTFVLCGCFSLALVMSVQGGGDGGWYWYATFFHSGRRLYADLHLALQPLFVLENDAALVLLGKSWLASRLPAFLHAIAYAFGLVLVLQRSKLSDRQKALVLACSYSLTLMFEAYRFDDYHVVADCFEVYSIAALLALRSANRRQRIWLSLGIGVMCGLSLMTRLNDGAALILSVGLALLCLAPDLICLAASLSGGIVAVLSVIRLTGDTFSDYVKYSIVTAAGAKGGAGSVLLAPLVLPYDSVRYLRGPYNKEFAAYLVGALAVCSFLIVPFLRTRRAADSWKALLGLLLLLLPLRHFWADISYARVVLYLTVLAAPIAYGLGITVIVRWCWAALSRRAGSSWNPNEILLLIPLSQLASGSMSSRGMLGGLFAPFAVMILVLSVASPIRLKSDSAKTFAQVAMVFLVVCSVFFKYNTPYLWHGYWSSKLFSDREWYQHPIYGPMLIDSKLLEFVHPMCSEIERSGSRELLSLPFPFPNYFCGLEPWHGYVQSFFDTSTRQSIEHIETELATAPPEWIVYQRQLDNLRYHEIIFNHGQPLPQRDLDRLIEQRVTSGEWQVVYTSNYSSAHFKNTWYLIRTHH